MKSDQHNLFTWILKQTNKNILALITERQTHQLKQQFNFLWIYLLAVITTGYSAPASQFKSLKCLKWGSVELSSSVSVIPAAGRSSESFQRTGPDRSTDNRVEDKS